MKYVMMIWETQEDFAARANEKQGEYWGAWSAYSQALSQAGILAGGSALREPATTTTVTIRDGKRQVQDGPYADSKEQVGGYMVLDVESLDVALEWAASCPAAASVAVELRPVLPMNA